MEYGDFRALRVQVGEGIARVCHREGANLMIADVRGDAAHRVAATLGERARAQACDVRDDAALQALADETVRAFGRIDGLVNNAGIAVIAPLEQETLDGWRRTQASKVEGVFLGSREAVRFPSALATVVPRKYSVTFFSAIAVSPPGKSGMLVSLARGWL